MLTDIKMLFFSIRHTYLLASPPEFQTAIDYHRQYHGDPPAPWSGSEQWCHIVPIAQPVFDTISGLWCSCTWQQTWAPSSTERSEMQPFAHPVRCGLKLEWRRLSQLLSIFFQVDWDGGGNTHTPVPTILHIKNQSSPRVLATVCYWCMEKPFLGWPQWKGTKQ